MCKGDCLQQIVKEAFQAINAVPVSQSTKQVYNLLIEMITLLYPQEERIPECISFLGLECDA